MEYSEFKYLFVGKLDDWFVMWLGVLVDVKCISFFLSLESNFLSWDDIVKIIILMEEMFICFYVELVMIIYIFGIIGMLKGVMYIFNSIVFGVS